MEKSASGAQTFGGWPSPKARTKASILLALRFTHLLSTYRRAPSLETQTSQRTRNPQEIFCPKPSRCVPHCIPFQQIHCSPIAIPPHIADMQCDILSTEFIMNTLNGILDTKHRIDAGFERCLKYIRQETRYHRLGHMDFGTVYGFLRPWWAYATSHNFGAVHNKMEMHKHDIKMLWCKAAQSHATSASMLTQ
ncbi:hypothetical protein PHLGIDRAFT_380732 [Phlebiopsis gigantea 11061_1 CR5-6]|uniref:Uncharacterized protein n=1 Tax=Phlebiopsis gigantea (strain 11061_1 CR5-6) TaxID=745531 RepID=A0A0C3PNK8_PHLG1|nr:hypothetical protein PHLGIDRAFT_380732 [Phlebiopsis gigantea 11061_1 CR5-6]